MAKPYTFALCLRARRWQWVLFYPDGRVACRSTGPGYARRTTAEIAVMELFGHLL